MVLRRGVNKYNQIRNRSKQNSNLYIDLQPLHNQQTIGKGKSLHFLQKLMDKQLL